MFLISLTRECFFLHYVLSWLHLYFHENNGDILNLSSELETRRNLTYRCHDYILFVSLIKVDGLCYLLQEIYGIENKLNQKNGKVCVVYFMKSLFPSLSL